MDIKRKDEKPVITPVKPTPAKGSKMAKVQEIRDRVDEMHDFWSLQDAVQKDIESAWNTKHSSSPEELANMETYSENLREALKGDATAEEWFFDKIREAIHDFEGEDTEFPPYYRNLVEAIYHESWGLAGLAEWFEPKLKESSSAKIIGDRIYFLIDGTQQLMPQRLPNERRKQLVKRLLSIKPEERQDKFANEIYLIDGTRVTIFNDVISKDGQDSVVFRRYVVTNYTFEEQARRHTIPPYAIEFLKCCVALGFNVAMTGEVRSSKTTFLTTYQSYEDRVKEGVILETDAEIPLHKIMPEAPIMQIVADGEDLLAVIKHILRSDGNYIIMGEARDGYALDTFIQITNKGTRMCKMTFHNKFPHNFAYDVANMIVRKLGGDVALVAESAATAVNYIFHFAQLADNSQKRLEGIYEQYVDINSGKIYVHDICKYRYATDDWVWSAHLCDAHREAAAKVDVTILNKFESYLQQFAALYPNTGQTEFVRDLSKRRVGGE